MFYDSLETRSRAAREAAQFAQLRGILAHAKAHAPHYAEALANVDASAVTDRSALAKLPVTRKSDLHALQHKRAPFGGLITVAQGDLARLFVSPGPIYDPEGKRADYWRTARVMFAAGFRRGDVVQNCFSYHLTPAGSMFETGLHALGCAVIPGGTGQTEMQAQTMADLRPVGYVGTPSFLKLILEKADEMKLDTRCLQRAVVSGEALLPPVREFLNARQIALFQGYGTADLGMVAYESEAREGLLVDEGVILELLIPGTGDPVAEGEVGEVTVTLLNPEYPLIRFATGDLSAVLPGTSSCGRTNTRIKGWMGRADQTTKVRGMFVHPHQVSEIVKRHPQIQRARLVVGNQDGQDSLTLRCEVSAAPVDLANAIEMSVRDVTKLRGNVEIVPANSLPSDGRAIEDARKYS